MILRRVYYVSDGDESAKQKKERQLETVKKRLAKSAAVRELHREYTDAPEEIRVSLETRLFFLISGFITTILKLSCST